MPAQTVTSKFKEAQATRKDYDRGWPCNRVDELHLLAFEINFQEKCATSDRSGY